MREGEGVLGRGGCEGGRGSVIGGREVSAPSGFGLDGGGG